MEINQTQINCKVSSCKYNVCPDGGKDYFKGSNYCNLKNIEIDGSTACCMNYQDKRELVDHTEVTYIEIKDK